MRGKDKINPPVGPAMDCQPPVKFANTGRPTEPSITYMMEAIAPFFEPKTMPAKVIAKVCMVNGTPKGIGITICAIIVMTAVKRPIMHKSLICKDCFFIIFPRENAFANEYKGK